MRGEGGLLLALVPTCPCIRKDDPVKLRKAAEDAAREALEYSRTHPEIVIEYRADYQVILKVQD